MRFTRPILLFVGGITVGIEVPQMARTSLSFLAVPHLRTAPRPP
jgi:hypothetical protein